MPRVWETIGTGLKAFRFPGYSGGLAGQGGDVGWGAWNRTLPGSQYDYRRESGNLWENAVVYALLSWQASQFAQAPLVVEEPGDNPGEYEHIENHPLALKIKRPNPFWTRRDLWGATLLSVNVGQSAYWIKVRSGAGKVVQLWWVPHWMMWPMWPSDGSSYITGYRYRVQGKNYDYRPQDVVHFRNNIINPLNQRVSLGSFSASLREVCTENEAATFMAAMCRNRGFPGVILSPKGENTEQIPKEQMQTVKRLWKEEFSGDGAGNVFASNVPLDVTIPQFEPDKMAVPETRGISTARICAGFGVDPMVIGLQSDQKTYSNYEEANRAAWEHNVVPTQGMIAETLDVQLLPDYEPVDADGQAAVQVGFDNTRVAALQEKRDALYKRITLAVGGPWLTPNEGRAEAGLDEIEGGDELLTQVQHQQQLEQQDAANEARDAQAGERAAKVLMERWRMLPTLSEHE